MLSDFFSLFFPSTCVSCGELLTKGEEELCTRCNFILPKTNFHTFKDNPVEKIFIGRVPIEFASSCYLFQKGNHVQELIHQIKYKNRKEAAFTIGKQYAHDLKGLTILANVDYIIPVPLSKQREKERGFNQSEWFANGLAEILKIPIESQAIVRTNFSETQTRKSRMERVSNIDNQFEVLHQELIAGKNILLVDDVITTGNTLDAVANKLLGASAKKISILTMAYTAL